MDRISRQHRSWNMSRIRGRDTKPEIVVRSLLHGLGYRFRLHIRTLPGTPDIVLPRHRKIVLVHGCFWHMHRCRYGRVVPKTNATFWQQKRDGNRQRDRRSVAAMRRMGWEVLVVWECWLRDLDLVRQRLLSFIGP